MKSKTGLFDKLILSAYDFYWTSQQQEELARRRIEHILTILTRYGAQPGQRILDAACGSGFYTLALAQVGFQTLGIDFMPLLMERARGRAKSLKLPAEFEKMNLDNELWFDRNEFDHALCLLALHQLGNPGATLAELNRVIKPDGLLLLTLWTDQTHYPEEFENLPEPATPSAKAKPKAQVRNLGERAFKKAYGLTEKRNPPKIWNAPDLQALLEKHGFEVLEIGGQPMMTVVARAS